MPFKTEHLSVSIERPAADVYAYVADPNNLPTWAYGLCDSIHQVDGAWIANSPMGKVVVEFAHRNDLGVLDHQVTVESGESFSNPMRVFANHEGCELVFTLFRRPEMSDREFAVDAATVKKDLEKLKQLLEQ